MAFMTSAMNLSDDALQRVACDEFVDQHVPHAGIVYGSTSYGVNWTDIKARLWSVVSVLKSAGISWAQIWSVMNQIVSSLVANASASTQAIVNMIMALLNQLYSPQPAPVPAPGPVNMP
jgi:hypothetical protein